MILFYSVGGGLGHLTRFSAFYEVSGLNEPVTIVASSPFVKDNRVVAGIHRTIIPPFSASKDQQSLVEWFQKLINELSPEKVYIDAFPGGILGELNHVRFPAECKLYLLARIIKWQSYQERIPDFKLHFNKVFILEALAAEYVSFLTKVSDQTENLQLPMPPISVPPITVSDNAWLVIHSGPDSELQQLLEKVEKDLEKSDEKPEVIVIYPGKRPAFVRDDFRFENLYPSFALYPSARRVYSAAGFNMVHQMRDFRYKHHVMPFPRLIDDQFARVELHRSEFAAILKDT